MFGRRLEHAGLELEAARFGLGPAELALALFTDCGRATRGWQPGAAWQVDSGAGVRLRLPGASGAVRIDLARGLRDARYQLSAGWLLPWPGLGER